MGQGIEGQLVEALAIGTRDLQRHRDGCPAFAPSRAPWCRRRSATPGQRRSAAPGRRRSATPGQRRSAAPGRRRSAAPGRRATPSLSAKSRYVRLQRAVIETATSRSATCVGDADATRGDGFAASCDGRSVSLQALCSPLAGHAARIVPPAAPAASKECARNPRSQTTRRHAAKSRQR